MTDSAGSTSPSPSLNDDDYPPPPVAGNRDYLVQCQGCGAVRDGSWLDKGHACWRNEDGTYEEGGTFQ